MMSKGPQLTTSNSEWVEEPDNTITGLWFVGREKDKDLVLTKARATTATSLNNRFFLLLTKDKDFFLSTCAVNACV